MTNKQLAFKGSPFLPRVDISLLTRLIQLDIENGLEPAPAIAIALLPLMDIHIQNIQTNSDLLREYDIAGEQLQTLTLGYLHPLCAIMASAVCRKYAQDKRVAIYDDLVMPSIKLPVLSLQHQVFSDLNATINIFKIDPSGALIFQYLKDYPFSKDHTFIQGMEISAILFFGLALVVAKETGNDDWLQVQYDPTIT